MSIDYNLNYSHQILLTSEKGEKLSLKNNVKFCQGLAKGNVINVQANVVKQTLLGIGTSFTESSAFVLAHLDKNQRKEIMNNIFSSEGADFSITRTHIGACDFCVEGKYSYADVKGDENLEYFNIFPDSDGFDKAKYIGIKDDSYDLLPMIKEALLIKQKQQNSELKIIASAWTAPAWMKDIQDWYLPQHPDGEGNEGTGGSLLKQYESTYADYLIKYLDAYQTEGVPIDAITPVNEPLGNSGQWESMVFTPETQRDFIKNHLGPKLQKSEHKNIDVLIFDHSRDQLELWADVIYGDPKSAQYVHGAAIHWYESTFRVFEEELDKVHQKYPNYSIVHTEGCIDDLGKDAPEGVRDPIGYKESGWFENDEFWWNENATDWGYTVPWLPVDDDNHPMYTPVHRYARNIIVSLDHWVSGWIDWNIVLDHNGGPNHVGNFCGAPIMIDTETASVYYTPIYYILAQFSKTIRPGDKVVATEMCMDSTLDDSVYACSVINADNLLTVHVLNTKKSNVEYSLQIGLQFADITLEANALQTIQVQLNP